MRDSAIREAKGRRGGHSLDGLVGREEGRDGQRNARVAGRVGDEFDGMVGQGDGLARGDYGAGGAEAFDADGLQQRQRLSHHYLDDQLEQRQLEHVVDHQQRPQQQEQQEQQEHAISAIPYAWWQQESPAGSWPEFRGAKYRGCAQAEGGDAQAAGG